MAQTQDDLLEKVARIGQQALNGPPLIILGSGASMAHGVGGMGELGKHLATTVTPNPTDKDIWSRFRKELSTIQNLEVALQKVTLPERLLDEVVKTTHALVSKDDRKVYSGVVQGTVQLPLSKLFRRLFQSTHYRISIVTTNYDRLAEYAANAADFAYYTGFKAGLLGIFDDQQASHPKVRTVDIWKVHGSIDWFKDCDGVPLCVDDVPLAEHLMPLIVTPGTTKYQAALSDPFRSILSEADKSMTSAQSVLCVGFGFRDTHVEPNLVKRLKKQTIPVVVLARTLTSESKLFLVNRVKSNYVAIEECASGSRIFTDQATSGIEVDTPSLWTLEEFLNLTLGTQN